MPDDAAAQESLLERVDVFGSKQLDRDALLATFGPALEELMRARGDDDKKRALEARIAAAGDFAFVDIAVITYFTSNRSYVTVDLVDEADRARRMTFAPAPAGEHPDPDHLIALWRDYEGKALSLLAAGTIEPSATEPCPFFHCITFAHASLAPFADAFATRVAPVEDALATILRDDRRADHRAFAAFLLAHITSGPRLVELLVPAILDPSHLVRNNAMRVLASVARHHPSIELPLAHVLAALHFPTTTDRNKAAAILDGIAAHAGADTRAQIEREAGDVLVTMLALRQPNNRGYAYSVLKAISGEDFGEHAVDRWQTWLRR